MNLIKSILGCTFILASTFVTNSGGAAVRIGEPAPDFVLSDIGGQTHRLSDYKNQIVVLEWVNPECPFVGKHYRSGNIPNLQKTAKADGVVWLSVNTGEPGEQGVFDAERHAAWAAATKASPAAYLRDPDGKVGRLYGAKTTPHIFVITPAGLVAYNGAIDSIRSADVADIAKAENYVASALASVKAGKPVSKATSQPYGCSVKY